MIMQTCRPNRGEVVGRSAEPTQVTPLVRHSWLHLLVVA